MYSVCYWIPTTEYRLLNTITLKDCDKINLLQYTYFIEHHPYKQLHKFSLARCYWHRPGGPVDVSVLQHCKGNSCHPDFYRNTDYLYFLENCGRSENGIIERDIRTIYRCRGTGNNYCFSAGNKKIFNSHRDHRIQGNAPFQEIV